jgi:hypothetical protein
MDKMTTLSAENSRATREFQGLLASFRLRKEIGCALKVNAISPEAKAAAKAAKLDDNGSALLKIASERSPEAQLAKVRKLATRKRKPRRKSSIRDGDERATNGPAQSDTVPISISRTLWTSLNRPRTVTKH